MNDGRSQFIKCVKKAAKIRTDEDVDVIASELMKLEAVGKFFRSNVREIARCVHYETYGAKKIIFNQDDEGRAWYVILSGSVDVQVVNGNASEQPVTICSLFSGHGFGELALINNERRKATVIARELTAVLRVDKVDFRRIWERQQQDLVRGPVCIASGRIGAADAGGPPR